MLFYCKLTKKIAKSVNFIDKSYFFWLFVFTFSYKFVNFDLNRILIFFIEKDIELFY